MSRRRCGRVFKGANESAASPKGKVVGLRPGLRQTKSKLVVRKISAIWARVSNGIYNYFRISIPRVLTNRKILRIKYGDPTKNLVDGRKTRVRNEC